jgi:2,5-diketo-D-gluconate reductase B
LIEFAKGFAATLQKDGLRSIGTENIAAGQYEQVPLIESLTGLQKAKEEGLIRSFGVSNFTIPLLEEAVRLVGANQIETNQVELHPYLQNRQLVSWMKDRGIHVTSYMTLAYGKVLQDPAIESIASKNQLTPAQVVLGWALQKGYSVIPSSTKEENLKSNLKASQVSLSPSDLLSIDQLERDERLINPKGLAPTWG